KKKEFTLREQILFFNSRPHYHYKGTQKNETGLVTSHGSLPIHNVSSSSNVITIFAAPRKNVLRVFANSACA
ncbi:MAG: hypothetical protein AB2768_06135, partial [Candidatus Thiodiazotropha endolucinida]